MAGEQGKDVEYGRGAHWGRVSSRAIQGIC